VQLAPRVHFSRFVDEVLPGVLADTVGFVRITSPAAICAMALRIKDLALLPIAIFQNE
jgi:hypothetical protein